MPPIREFDLGRGIDPFAKFALGEKRNARRHQLFSSRISRIFLSIRFIMEADRRFCCVCHPLIPLSPLVGLDRCGDQNGGVE